MPLLIPPWRYGPTRRSADTDYGPLICGLLKCGPVAGRMVFAGLTAVITLALVAHASAQQVDDAMTWALRTSTSLKADFYRQQATEAHLRGSVEAFLPRIEWQQQRILGSHYSYSPDLPAQTGPSSFATREPDQFGVQATLPLFDGFKRYNTYKAASLGVEAGKYLSINARQQVMLDAATAYLAVVRDRSIVAFRRQQVDNIARMSDLTDKRYELRDSTQTDVALSDSRLLAAKAAVKGAQADLAASEIEFARLTGSGAGRLAPPHTPDWLVPRSRDEMRAALTSDNPELIAARLDAKAARFSADAVKSEMLPTINLIASHGQNNDSTPLTPKITDTTIKLQIRIPIYEPGAYSHIQEVSALATQKNYDVIDTQARTLSSADSLYVTRQSLIQQANQATGRVSAMRRAVDGYRVEQAAGYRTIIDVLNALNELAEAQVFQAQIAFTRDKATYMLVAALARLEPSTSVAMR